MHTWKLLALYKSYELVACWFKMHFCLYLIQVWNWFKRPHGKHLLWMEPCGNGEGYSYLFSGSSSSSSTTWEGSGFTWASSPVQDINKSHENGKTWFFQFNAKKFALGKENQLRILVIDGFFLNKQKLMINIMLYFSLEYWFRNEKWKKHPQTVNSACRAGKCYTQMRRTKNKALKS